MDVIMHICPENDWEAARAAGNYKADSLETEGFIHCSRPEQVLDVANRYYGGRTDLLLLWIDPIRLAPEVRWEPSEDDIYPHLYGPLNLAAVTQVSVFRPDADGHFHNLHQEKYP